MQNRTDSEARDKVWALIKDIKIAQFVTQDNMNRLHSRPMSAVGREDNVLWFMTRDDSGKVTEIEHHPQVLLSYSEPDNQNYVSIRGTAQVIRDRAKIESLWTEFARVWFPQGPADPSITLIRVEAEAAEYWDSPSSSFVYAVGYLKARLTGKTPTQLGEVAHVEMKAG